MRTRTILAGICTALIAAPFITSAATITDLQAEITSLLGELQSLQAQGSASSSATVSGTAASPCSSFTRSLSVGSSGSDVSALQAYLDAHGYLSVSPTGYFGALTKTAVGTWQAQSGIATSGSAGFGVFGPLSRAYFARTCSGGTMTTTGSTTSTSFSASPASGAAPLTVQFTATAPQGATLGTTVSFGDGSSGTLGVVPTCSSCNEEGVVSHTYASVGTYNATLTNDTCSCPANGICNCPNIMVLGTATVTVTGGGSGANEPNLEQVNAPASLTLTPGGIAEIRNESFYFTLENLTASSATIQLTPVGCWNSFPSDPTPKIMCMLAMIPIPPQTLSVGQTYTSAAYGITLTQIVNGTAMFSVSATSTQ